MLSKLALSAWYVFVVILASLAVAMAVARGYPAICQKYLPEIQENISTILGQPVRVGSIRIDWRGITPNLSIRNLSIHEAGGQYEQLLYVDAAEISLNLYRSVLQRNIVIKELTLVGGNLEATRTIDEKVILNKIDISRQLAKRKQSNTNNEFRVILVNSSISLHDEVKKLSYFFDRVDIMFGITNDHFSVASKFTLPNTLGESLSIIADIRDLDKGLKKIKGEVYAKGENINLELLDDLFPGLRVGIKKGFSDFEIWGDFGSLKKRLILGHLYLKHLVYRDTTNPLDGIASQQGMTSFKTKFRLRGDTNDWHLMLSDVDVLANKHQWPARQYEVSCKGCEHDRFTLSAALDYVHVDQLLSTIQHFPFIIEKISDLLSNTMLQGELQETEFSFLFDHHKLSKYTYKTALQGVNIFMPNQEIALLSISGVVSGDHVQGGIELSTNAATVQLGKVLNHPLEDQHIQGHVTWRGNKKNFLLALQSISLQHAEMSALLQGSVQIQQGLPYVDIQIELSQARAATIMKYFPHKRMRPKFLKWLTEAMMDGNFKNSRLLFHGNPKNFLFKNKPGRFQISAEMSEGRLKYHRNWPQIKHVDADLEISNQHLAVHVKRGVILDSKIDDTHFAIEDLKLPKLIVDGYAKGPVNNIFQYLQQSSLLPNNSQLIKHLSVSGDMGMKLDLIITLTKKIAKEFHMNGQIELKKSALHVNALALPFADVQGTLNFDSEGIEGDGITGRLYGLPVSASVKKLGAGRTHVSVEGDLDLETYLSSNYEKIAKYVQGSAPVTASISIPHLNKKIDDKSLKVELESNLFETKITLPEPFQKDFQQPMQLAIRTKHQRGIDGELFASLNDQAFLHAILDRQTGNVSRMEMRMGDERFALPEQGAKVSGWLKSLDLGEWHSVIKEGGHQNEITVSEIDLAVEHVVLGGLDLGDVSFNARKNLQFWSGDIDSAVARGEFSYPVDTTSGRVATASFDYLRFGSADRKANKDVAHLDPRTLPAIVVNSKSFEYHGVILNDFHITAKPTQAGLSIDSLRGWGNDLHASASGTWKVVNDDQQMTNLSIHLETKSVQNSLSGLGFDSAIAGGEGSVTASLAWPMAPHQFSFSSVIGNANIRFDDGVISFIESGGAGRILGLVNFSEITRRLSLDFKDLFSKGYTFDRIRGNLHFEDANLSTEDLNTQGPSADILIRGRTGISARDYDQIVTVTPHISGGLPWIGLAIGGPVGAVGVAVAREIAKSMGINVNKVTEVQYSVKGSWDDPVIEPISGKPASQKAPATREEQPSSQFLPDFRRLGSPVSSPSPS